MTRMSLLSPGLYRICRPLPGHGPRPTAKAGSKRRTSALLGLLVLVALPVRAGVVDLVPTIKAAVVGVGTFNPTQNPRATLMGTGFAVGDGRHVVSCAHIFTQSLDSEKKETYAVLVGRDRQVAVLTARIVARDTARDLALLRIEGGARLPALQLAPDAAAREGQELYFTGYPIGSALGLNASTHRAGLAAIIPIYTPLQRAAQLTARTLRQAQDAYEVYELDAVAYPGNSGSPVWHPETGEVVGVVNSVYVKGAREAALTAPSGISYAIPVKYVRQLLETGTSPAN